MREMLKWLLVAATIASAESAFADDLTAEQRDAGHDKLAELMAWIRIGPDRCAPEPPMWQAEVMALYVAAGRDGPVETDILDQEDNLNALRSKIGWIKWCELFDIELKAVDAIVGPPTKP